MSSSTSSIPVADPDPSTPIPFPDLTGKIVWVSKDCIANGGNSSIYAGKLVIPGGETIKVAIKVLRCNGNSCDPAIILAVRRRLERESNVWHGFDHPNLLQFLGMATDLAFSSTFPTLISPYCERKSVLEYIKAHPEVIRLPIILGVAKGLQYLHSRDAIHGDIRASNVLMGDNGEPLLCDFGRCKVLGSRGYTTDFACAYRYMPPEILNWKPAPDSTESKPMTTRESDVYAFGLIAFEVLSGLVVYHGKGDHTVYKHVSAGRHPAKEDCQNPDIESFWSMLEECWNKDPAQRPTIDKVMKHLRGIPA
ncbi:TKL/TKL-ccin protein kinase [Ephemerocybe angulata]|uniref:TKL/TKL-ccin protein kinase n=1 Tax=Ephemerocybe angulata TaxID=980116 RepID=A0A8H6HVK4_9AGAR|nr:TKL/TKL-ccin protein kinase [Tulosesus angulatus]